eukprot:COSAG01_NODE_26034_length_725_cov_1.412141_1_plen_136_part_10
MKFRVDRSKGSLIRLRLSVPLIGAGLTIAAASSPGDGALHGRCPPPFSGRALALPCLPPYIHSHVYTNQSHQQSVNSHHPTLLTTCALRADPLPRPAFRTHDDARTTAPACSELFSPASAIDSNVLPLLLSWAATI